MKSKERPLTWTRTVYLFVALVLASLALILLSQGRQLQPIESAASQVLTPIQQAAHDVTATVGGWIEMLRIDTVNHLGPFRLNVWTSIVMFLLATAFFLLTRRRAEPAEESQSFDDGAVDRQ